MFVQMFEALGNILSISHDCGRYNWKFGSFHFQQAVATCFAKYVDFSGRASRAEYWWFFLAYIRVTNVERKEREEPECYQGKRSNHGILLEEIAYHRTALCYQSSHQPLLIIHLPQQQLPCHFSFRLRVSDMST